MALPFFGVIMFTERHYVPALRWRQGEFGALAELRQNQKDALTPLIDVAPIAWDFEEDRPSREIDAHLSRIPTQMAASWGTLAPLFVDMGLIDPALRMVSGEHPLFALFERLSGLYHNRRILQSGS
jgi:Beta protein